MSQEAFVVNGAKSVDVVIMGYVCAELDYH